MLSMTVFVLALFAYSVQSGAPSDAQYLTWSASQAEAIGKSTYGRGRVGGFFNTRMLKTERAYNYKLAATWVTPDVIRATARLLQLRSRLSEHETRQLVADAERAGEAVFIVEIDPREGSGVIPNDWEAFLQPKGEPNAGVRGTMRPELREVRALAGVMRRNYDYDRFWVSFSLSKDGQPLFKPEHRAAELVVRIYDKEGRVEWSLPVTAR